MAQGKITIESGEYKATFSISNENAENEQKVQIDFNPPLPAKEEMKSEAAFVQNITNFLIWYLKGGE